MKRRRLLDLLMVLLLLGSLVFFYQCISFLSRRDYIAAVLLLVIGFSVLRAGAELARLALLDDRD